MPAELNGTRGLYRRPQAQCLLKATNDYQAILAWLRSKHGLTPDQKAHLKARRRQRDTGVEQGLDWLQALSNTQRAYRKEAERFLLWAITHKGKALVLDGATRTASSTGIFWRTRSRAAAGAGTAGASVGRRCGGRSRGRCRHRRSGRR